MTAEGLWARQPLPAAVNAPVPPQTPWIGDILGALAFSAGVPAQFLPQGAHGAAAVYGLEAARSNVVIMVDGLGLIPLQSNLGYAPTLRRIGSEPTAAQTTSPSTTAAALTSFATGALPGTTRMVGYSVAVDRGVMNLLHFRPGVDARGWQPVATVMERLAEGDVATALVTDAKFRGSGLTEAAMRGAQFVSAGTLTERFSAAARQVRKGVPLVYVYWSAIDAAGHASGPGSERWRQELEDFDSALGRFLKQVAGAAQVVLTADHGMVEAGERVDIAAVPELNEGVTVLAGEGRAAHVHAAANEAPQVEARWRDYWGARAWVFNRDQMPFVLGTGAGLSLIGDLLVMPKGREVVVDSRTQSAASIAMPGVHGSLTEDEMLIPVWRLL